MSLPAEPNTVSAVARLIDHSLLHPTMTDAEVQHGLDISRKYHVATACIKPYSIPQAMETLKGTGVGICVVIGFPHGNSTTIVKVFEATEAMDTLQTFVRAGGEAGGPGLAEIDMVVNVGKVLSGEWGYVEHEIATIDAAVVARGGGLKVIFENDFLQHSHIAHLAEICARVGVKFVKTSTGFGFVKDAGGGYHYRGAQVEHIQIMRAGVGEKVQIKAAGGIRTLDQLLAAYRAGATRIGATATEAMLSEARARGWPEN
ncbi:hypothetical protein BKA93DRAFT_778340 [Sparassis latifolia]